jgi:hypothetical protein
MEQFEIKKVDGGFHVEGFPDAVKVIRLHGHKPKRLADLALHRSDLAFAMACLEGINQISADQPVLREGLWRSAIVHLMKCYGSNDSRFNLDVKSVLKGDLDWKEVFKFFYDLRNMHLVHDSNAYSQCLPGAILNKEGMDHKIAKITCMSFHSQTLDQPAYGNLHLLITRSLEWVVQKFDALCEDLTSELEAVPYQDLIKRDSVTYKPPKLEEIDKRRKFP